MADLVVNYHFLNTQNGFDYHHLQRSLFQDVYADFVAAESGLAGRVLDIGCGHSVDPTLGKIITRIGTLDGVDPFPVIEPSLHLANRWTCLMEEIPVPDDTYDLAYSYNVVEHVDNIDSFLDKIIGVLKPGGIYWSMSPNSRHPFTWVTRMVQATRLKNIYRKFVHEMTNDYPAYYRLSNDRRILSTVRRLALPISQIDFYYMPNVQWDRYFPRRLAVLANWVDRLFLLKKPKASFIFMFRLKKA